MGDWSDSLGMSQIAKIIEDNTPEGMYVHSLKIGGDGSGIDSHVSEIKDLILKIYDIMTQKLPSKIAFTGSIGYSDTRYSDRV